MTALARRPSAEHASGLWTADQFLDFYMTRPDEERWQLVDGLAMMMVPPSFMHQRIAENFMRLLDGRSGATPAGPVRLSRTSDCGFPASPISTRSRMSLVCRADAAFDYYADRFFLVAEVISPSNTAEMIERKLELYQSHPDNLYCLTIDQDSVHVDALRARDGLGADRPSFARRCAEASRLRLRGYARRHLQGHAARRLNDDRRSFRRQRLFIRSTQLSPRFSQSSFTIGRRAVSR